MLSQLPLADALALAAGPTHLARQRGLLAVRQRCSAMMTSSSAPSAPASPPPPASEEEDEEEAIAAWVVSGLPASPDPPPSWEQKAGACAVASAFLRRHAIQPGERLTSQVNSTLRSASTASTPSSAASLSHEDVDIRLSRAILSAMPLLLSDREVRVRSAAAHCLQAVANCLGAQAVWAGVRSCEDSSTANEGLMSSAVTDGVCEPLMASIARDFERVEEAPAARMNQEQTATNPASHDEDGVEMVVDHHDFGAEVAEQGEQVGGPNPKDFVPDADLVGEKKTALLHDTEGWRTLETSFAALESVMRGSGRTFAPFVNDALVELLVRSGTHANRFVRESGYNAIGVLCAIASPSETDCAEALGESGRMGEMPAARAPPTGYSATAHPAAVAAAAASAAATVANSGIPTAQDNVQGGGEREEDAVAAAQKRHDFACIADRLVPAIVVGLADNWSQVRFAASVAARQFLAAIRSYGLADATDEEAANRQRWEEVLVPRMCLNRHYGAEGVRLYSQNTWVQAFGLRGRILVQEHMAEIVAYYSACATADNHSVREAACACIAELATGKVALDTVEPHAAALLATLVLAFHDESWPVRDAACLASGEFIAAFPQRANSDPQFAAPLEDLWKLWMEHLSDNIWSVRQDSAVSLGRVMRALGSPAVNKVFMQLGPLLRLAKEQPIDNDVRRFSNLSEKPAVFSVAAQRHARANDPELHSNQQLFSCGSLAPKLKAGGGCSDHSFRRPPQPWESSDGAIYLVREFSSIAPEMSAMMIPILADLIELDFDTATGERRPVFHQFPVLLETLFKQMPAIIKHTGPSVIQGALGNRFFRAAIRALSAGHRPTMSAAGYCLEELAQICGPESVEAVLTDDDRALFQLHRRFVRYPFVPADTEKT